MFALLGIVSISAIRDAFYLFRYPVASGVNAYYYVLQVNSLRNTGHLYFPKRTSAVLYFLTATSSLFNDTPKGLKVGAIIIQAALCVGVFFLTSEYTRSRSLALTGTLLFVISNLHFYFMTEFISNLGAVTLLVWSSWCLVRFNRDRKAVWLVLSGILLVGAVLSHRSILPFVALLTSIGAACRLLLDNRPNTKTTILALSMLAALWLTPALLGAQKFVSLPVLLTNEFSALPHAPFDHYAFPEEIVLALSSLIVVVVILQKPNHKDPSAHTVLMVVALFALIVTLNPFLTGSRGWLGITARLRGLSYLQASILLPGVFWLLLEGRKKVLAAYIAAFMTPLIITSATLPLPPGMEAGYLERRQKLIQGLRELDVSGTSTMIVAQHGDQFVVTATLGIPAQQQLPVDQSRYDGIYWLLRHVDDPSLINESVVLFRDGAATVIVENGKLERHLATMGITERNRLLNNNPHLARRVSVLERGS